MKAEISDQKPDYHWWTRLPNIVLSKVDDPYELALLFAIRKVAGDDPDDGVCYMGLRRLGKMTKMGFNTVRRKILSLAEKGLITAEVKKAPKGWNVYHINIPRSVWEDNERIYRELAQRGTDDEKVYQSGTDEPQREQRVPEQLQGCTRDDRGTVPETTPRLRTISTKNHTTKKVETLSEKRARFLERDEHGKYVDRSPLQRCKVCGQFQRECYCDDGPHL